VKFLPLGLHSVGIAAEPVAPVPLAVVAAEPPLPLALELGPPVAGLAFPDEPDDAADVVPLKL